MKILEYTIRDNDGGKYWYVHEYGHFSVYKYRKSTNEIFGFWDRIAIFKVKRK